MSKIAIYQGQVPSSQTELFSASTTSAIHAATACNTSGTDVTLEVWVAMTGGAASDGAKLYDGIIVPGNSQISLPLLVNHALPTGAKIHGQASSGGAVTLTVSGVRG